jgi:hypothetical protein
MFIVPRFTILSPMKHWLFYESGEQAAARPEEDFVLTADSPALADSQAFLDWRPPFAPDAEQRPVPTALRAVSIYQNLLRFHKADPAPKLAFRRGRSGAAQMGLEHRPG